MYQNRHKLWNIFKGYVKITDFDFAHQPSAAGIYTSITTGLPLEAVSYWLLTDSWLKAGMLKSSGLFSAVYHRTVHQVSVASYFSSQIFRLLPCCLASTKVWSVCYVWHQQRLFKHEWWRSSADVTAACLEEVRHPLAWLWRISRAWFDSMMSKMPTEKP